MSETAHLGLRCPTCRRAIGDEASCPRCGTEMEALRRIAEESDRFSSEGWRLLRAGGGQPAGAHAALGIFEAALRLRATEGARRGRIVALAACGRSEEAAGLLMAEIRADELRHEGGQPLNTRGDP